MPQYVLKAEKILPKAEKVLSGPSLDALTREAVALYGPEARIVRAERVLDGGLRGLLGLRHIEATVLVPEPAAAAVPHALAGRAGIAALLDDADRADAAMHAPGVSTQRERFDTLLEQLRAEFDAPEPRVPQVLDGVGDFVLVVGRDGAALEVVSSIAAWKPRWCVPASGLGGPIDAIAARADAVERSVGLLAAFTLGPLDALAPSLDAAAALKPDQVWLVVDARHKPDETAEWVEAASSSLHVDALAVLGARETRTPHTVNGLGVPVGWVDGFPAPRTVL